MNKSGFTLIEVLVATALAVMLSGALIGILYQLNRVMPVMARHMDEARDVALIHYQLMRDVSGAQVPLAVMQALAKQQAEAEQKEAPQEQGQPQKTLSKQEKKPVEIPIKKIFMSTTSPDGMLDTVSFITTNPLQPYWGAKTGTFIPRIVRVTYRLRPDSSVKKGPKSYVLLRQESRELDPEKMTEPDVKKWHAYTVVRNIKSCNVEYTAMIRKKEKTEGGKASKPEAQKQGVPPQPEQKPQEGAEKITFERKIVKDWQEKKPQPSSKKEGPIIEEPLIPQLMTMRLEIYDAAHKRHQPYTLVFPIVSQNVYPPEKGKSTSERLENVVKQLSRNVLSALKDAPVHPVQQRQVPTIKGVPA